MGGGRIRSVTPDLFSTVSPRDTPSLRNDASARYVLPSDLPAAIRHLDDLELNQLQGAVVAEQNRRGKKSPLPDDTLSKQSDEGFDVKPGKRNAVLAAFKAGVTPSRIAREFGVPQAEVRKVIASEGVKPRKRI